MRPSGPPGIFPNLAHRGGLGLGRTWSDFTSTSSVLRGLSHVVLPLSLRTDFSGVAPCGSTGDASFGSTESKVLVFLDKQRVFVVYNYRAWINIGPCSLHLALSLSATSTVACNV